MRPTAYLAEKRPLTYRIGSHSAGIKAASGWRWTIMVTASNRAGKAARTRMWFMVAAVNHGSQPGRQSRISRHARCGAPRRGRSRSGHGRAEGRGDDAADHATDGVGRHARTTHRLAFDHPPGAAISEQRCQHGVVQLVAALDRTI